jgi:hypothetical protein
LLQGRHSQENGINPKLSVDVHGKCGTLSYHINSRDQYYKELSKNYKFFLSFENSVCRDYVTEKLYLALQQDWVPVVMGGADYSEFVPEDAVIDASAFRSPAALSEYLHTVAANDALYRSYFKWKENFYVADAEPWICSACKKLRYYNKRKSYDDLHGWWVRESQCVTGKALQDKFGLQRNETKY